MAMLDGLDALSRVTVFPGELKDTLNEFPPPLLGTHRAGLGLQLQLALLVQLPDELAQVAVTADCAQTTLLIIEHAISKPSDVMMARSSTR